MKEFETKRLKLRAVNRNDASEIYTNWTSDPRVAEYVEWNAHEDISVTHAIMDFWLEEYKNDKCYRYGIELKDNKELIGMIDVVGYHHGNPVIGYCLGRNYWNNGYMSEALQGVVSQLISDGFTEIVVEAAEDNVASNRVILKNGFKFIGSREDKLSELKPQILKINSYRYYVK